MYVFISAYIGAYKYYIVYLHDFFLNLSQLDVTIKKIYDDLITLHIDTHPPIVRGI